MIKKIFYFFLLSSLQLHALQKHPPKNIEKALYLLPKKFISYLMCIKSINEGKKYPLYCKKFILQEDASCKFTYINPLNSIMKDIQNFLQYSPEINNKTLKKFFGSTVKEQGKGPLINMQNQIRQHEFQTIFNCYIHHLTNKFIQKFHITKNHLIIKTFNMPFFYNSHKQQKDIPVRINDFCNELEIAIIYLMNRHRTLLYEYQTIYKLFNADYSIVFSPLIKSYKRNNTLIGGYKKIINFEINNQIIDDFFITYFPSKHKNVLLTDGMYEIKEEDDDDNDKTITLHQLKDHRHVQFASTENIVSENNNTLIIHQTMVDHEMGGSLNKNIMMENYTITAGYTHYKNKKIFEYIFQKNKLFFIVLFGTTLFLLYHKDILLSQFHKINL